MGKLAPFALVSLVSILVAGCSGDPVEERTATANEIAVRVSDRAAAGLTSSDDPIAWLQDEVARVAAPSGIERLIAADSGSGGEDADRVFASVPVAVYPEEGEAYCVIIGVSDDGGHAGIAAEGDPMRSCRDARAWTPVSDPLLAG